MHRLTDISINAILPPASGQAVYKDDGSPLQLRVSAGGAKTFFIVVGDGKRHTIGRFGEVSLKDAREVARRIRAEKTLGRYTPSSVQVAPAREEYLAGIEVRPNTRTYYERNLGRLSGRLDAITPRDILRILDGMGQSSRNQALASFRAFFSWAIRKHYIDRSPCERMTLAKETARSRVLSDQELAAVWNATARMGRYGMLVKLLILTAQRRGEIAGLKSSFIENEICTLPPALTKNKRPHSFPICAQVAKIISEIPSGTTPLLFPARGTKDKLITGWSKHKAALDRRLGGTVGPFTLHDLRRTAATRMAELGVMPHIIERLLNHVSGEISGVAAVYNRAKYLAEIRTALELWERHVQAVASAGC